MKKTKTHTQTLLLALIGLILGLAAATTLPQVYAENRQHAEDGSAVAIADCDLNDIEEADFECIASAASEEGVIRDREPIPPPEPQTCEEGFEEFLTEEIAAVLVIVADGMESLEDFCNVIEEGITESRLRLILDSAGIEDVQRQDALIECLAALGIAFIAP